jgi:hypothetical protein
VPYLDVMVAIVGTAWRRISASTKTVKTAYVGALTLYAILGSAAFHGWANVVVVVALLAFIPLFVIAVQTLLAPRARHEGLLRPPPSFRAALEDELRRANDQGLATWWEQSAYESRWFDSFFAFWWKAAGVPADDVRVVCDEPQLTVSTFDAVPAAEIKTHYAHRKKASLVSASTFFSDVEPILYCAKLEYELARWVEQRAGQFRDANPEASLYGVIGWLPYPGFLVSHNVIMTADRWVLVSLRSSRTDYFPNTWSVSFEEQIEVGPGPAGPAQDTSVGHAVRRGLKEEFGSSVADHTQDINVLAIGREHVDMSGRSVRNSGVLTVVTLSLPLREVWNALSHPGHVQDIGESAGWLALRFQRRRDVVALVRKYPPNSSRGLGPAGVKDDHMLSAEVDVHSSSRERLSRPGGFGWHPTSRARLILWAEWASECRLLNQ